jgi:hypothetical protein
MAQVALLPKVALSDVSQRCKATSDLGATADIGRRYGLDGSVALTQLRHQRAFFVVTQHVSLPVLVYDRIIVGGRVT